MKLHEELLEVAALLCNASDTTAGTTRRSISTAYYALFHRVIHESSQLLFPEDDDFKLRAFTARAMEHQNMRQVCEGFAGLSKHKRPVAQLLANEEVPPSVKNAAALFGSLQEARHMADYDTLAVFTPTEASDYLQRVQDVFQALDRDKTHPVMRLFLASLLLAKNWRS